MNNIKFYKDISYLENLKKTLKNEIIKIQKIDNEIIKKNIIKKLYSLYKHIDKQLKPLLNYESINLELIPTPPDTEENILNLEEVLNSELSESQYDSLEELIPNNFNKPKTFNIFALINDMPQYEHMNSYMYYYKDTKPSKHKKTRRTKHKSLINQPKISQFKIKPAHTNLGINYDYNKTPIIIDSDNEITHIKSNPLYNRVNEGKKDEFNDLNLDNIKIKHYNNTISEPDFKELELTDTELIDLQLIDTEVDPILTKTQYKHLN
jgi:hypothetical protein